MGDKHHHYRPHHLHLRCRGKEKVAERLPAETKPSEMEITEFFFYTNYLPTIF